MTSQLDLDQGGTFREWVNTYLGPSVGWVKVPAANILKITTVGTFTALIGTTLVTVNVAGGVTVNLPSSIPPPAGAMAVPGPFTQTPITIVDIGGNAQNFPITILPAVGETLMGLSSIQILNNFGGYILKPNPDIPGWTTTS